MRKKTKKTRYVQVRLDVTLVLDKPVGDIEDVFDEKLLRDVASLAALLFLDGRGVKTNKAGKASVSLRYPKRKKTRS